MVCLRINITYVADHDLKQARTYGPDYESDRSLMWLLARQDNNGEYSNDATRAASERIVSNVHFSKHVSKP